MALPNYPNNPQVNDTFLVGNKTFQWDGEKWKALSNADNSLRTQLADPDSTVSIGGVEAGKLTKPVNLDQLGAAGNGTITNGVIGGTDDSAIIQSALDSGLRVVGDPKKLYRVNSTIANKGSNDLKDINLLIDESTSLGLRLGPSPSDAVATTTLTGSDPVVNTRDIEVVDATGFEAGQLITLKSTRVWPYDAPRNLNAGETNLIREVSGSTITLESPLADTYALGSETVTVSVFAPVTQRLDNVRVIRPTEIELAGMSVQYSITPLLLNCEAENCGSAGINLSSNWMAGLSNPRLKNCHITGGATGYGIQDNNGIYTVVMGMQASGCRRAIDFSGSYPSRFGIVSDFTVTGLPSTGSCVGTHGTSQGITFADGKCDGSLIGVQIRSPNCVIDNVDFMRNTTQIALSFTMSLTVQNCKSDPLVISSTVGSLAGVPARFIDVNNMPDNLSNREKLVVRDNRARTRLDFIRFSGSLNDGIKYANISNNFSDVLTNFSGNELTFINASTSVNMRECRIKDNEFTVNGHTGVFNFYSPNITIDSAAPNALQNVDLDLSVLQIAAGAGGLTVDNVDLRWDSDGEYVHVYGEVEFTVDTSPVEVIITDVPQKKDSSDLGTPMGGLFNGAFSEVLVTKNNRLDIWLSYRDFRSTGDLLEPFPVGTHAVAVDLTYKARFPLQ